MQYKKQIDYIYSKISPSLEKIILTDILLYIQRKWMDVDFTIKAAKSEHWLDIFNIKDHICYSWFLGEPYIDSQTYIIDQVYYFLKTVEEIENNS